MFVYSGEAFRIRCSGLFPIFQRNRRDGNFDAEPVGKPLLCEFVFLSCTHEDMRRDLFRVGIVCN